MIVESCCTTLEEALAAQQRGADRIELCADLSVGGITPSRDLIREVVSALTIPVNVLIRCRVKPGMTDCFSISDFVYDASDIVQMIDDIEFCKSVGAAGIVVGALTPEGAVDRAAMRRLIDAAQPLPVTFHRAFDVSTGDPYTTLDQLIALGCARLLSSGKAPTAWEGRGVLSLLVRRAAGRIIVMPGCGITPDNFPSLAAYTRAPEYHGTRLVRWA